ncbi:hypothetical protein [Ralstonia mannitolilytica]|uniref:Uncharacterized protein n=1 Tax=Ralstonia mannitolilytica TaxID=105219 RepID=A0AAD2AS08_9RALS|nr:hypothetical protein [Ralstonia mannitolilytica]CAJ0683721.1 hypothetical protein R77591_02357 [Ralstonia mannitolilytica]
MGPANRLGENRIGAARVGRGVARATGDCAAVDPFFSYGAIVGLLAAAVVCGLGTRCRALPGAETATAVAVIVWGLLTVAIELQQLFRVPNLPADFFSITRSVRAGACGAT